MNEFFLHLAFLNFNFSPFLDPFYHTYTLILFFVLFISDLFVYLLLLSNKKLITNRRRNKIMAKISIRFDWIDIFLFVFRYNGLNQHSIILNSNILNTDMLRLFLHIGIFYRFSMIYTHLVCFKMSFKLSMKSWTWLVNNLKTSLKKEVKVKVAIKLTFFN